MTTRARVSVARAWRRAVSDRRTIASLRRATRGCHTAAPLLAAFALLMAGAGCGAPKPQGARGPAPRTLAPRAQAAKLTVGPGSANHQLYGAFQCDACHPCGVKSPDGHGVTWMDRTSPQFHAAAANAGLAACQSCHGTSLDGVGGSTVVSCATCHGATWKTSCVMCHGGTDGQSGAPPKTTWGNAADAMRVGTHTAHLSATHGLSRPVACDACHVVPTDALAAGHLNGATATVTFSGLAALGVSPPPAWDRAQGTCANTYCHGGTLSGGAQRSPVWTLADGTQRACTSCHGAPPPSPHPQSDACETCHPGYGATTVNTATHLDGKVDVILSCSSCHGSATSPAPPRGTHGETATTTAAVGAHQTHLSAGTACSACHPVPSIMEHTNGTVELVAGLGWDGARCTSTYCHGTTLSGGTNAAPIWTVVDGTQAACGTCHGSPPPPPHPLNPACGTCHRGYTATTVNPATHVNGNIDVLPLDCNSCHGSAASAAPPTGTRGETSTATRAVGDHQVHLSGGPLSNPVLCLECHVTPTTILHSNGVVDMHWDGLASANGASPAWNGTTCSGIYCHGATLAGGTNTTPVWTAGSGQAACGTCHGAPPPSPHVPNPDCGKCHDGYGSGASSVNTATHVNGTIDVKTLACNSCHGSDLTPAPPTGVAGDTSTASLAVGAHQQHLGGGTLGKIVACSQCHVVPAAMNHANGVVEITWGTLAAKGGALPVWDPVSATCSSTYCHGDFTGGNAMNAPSWTVVDGSQAVCGSCHGLPPGGGHTPNTLCENCHDGYSSTSVNVATHIDGVVQTRPMRCNVCHGSDANNAPPRGTHGETETNTRAVGAHQRHLAGGAIGKAVACPECHVVPTAMDHTNNVVEVTFGPLSRRNGATPSYDRASMTCNSVYCHGATLTAGGANTTPLWTGGSAQAACGNCHAVPPPGPQHLANQECDGCHPGYTRTSVNPDKHMNGVVDAVNLSCTTCHGDATRMAVPGADPVLVGSAPPYGTHGETATTARAVGAHQKHAVTGSVLSAPIACDTCHVVPAVQTHANGRVDLVFSDLARFDGATPTWDGARCSNTYCHGATLAAGGTSHAPSWTGGAAEAACGSCHGVVPPAPHPQTGNCIDCHPGYTATSVRKATHVNGSADLQQGCVACHDIPPDSGEHTRHIDHDIDCNRCHSGYTMDEANPLLHRNGRVDVTLHGWDPSRLRCSNVGCHDSKDWGSPATSLQAQRCDRCHGISPDTGRHDRHSDIACDKCHGSGYAGGGSGWSSGWSSGWGGSSGNSTGATVNLATHMNGSVEIVISSYDRVTMSCDPSCHGRESWRSRGTVESMCTNCHDVPPPAPHPSATDCARCHPYMNADGTMPATHNDGTAALPTGAC